MRKNAGRKALPVVAALPAAADHATATLSAQALDIQTANERETLRAADVYRLVGRIETAQFMETVSGRLMAETYLKVKVLLEEQGSIMVRTRSGDLKHVSGMEEFCNEVMPVSARRCRQIVAAIDTLGASLYDQAEQLGFRARDYQALRALPDDQQAVVKRAIEAGDLNAALDVVHDLAARNQALQGKLKDADRRMAAKDRVIQEDREKITAMREAEARRLSADPGEREQQQTEDLAQAGLEAELALRRLIKLADDVDCEPASEAVKLKATQAIDYVFTLAQQLIHDTAISVSFAEAVQPSWFIPAAALRDRQAKQN